MATFHTAPTHFVVNRCSEPPTAVLSTCIALVTLRWICTCGRNTVFRHDPLSELGGHLCLDACDIDSICCGSHVL